MTPATDPAALLCALTGDDPESAEPVPYPVDALPAAMERFVVTGAASRGVPVDFIAGPLLGFAGAAIGDRVVLEVKRGWIERPTSWIACVGGPGTGKSPGADYARAPLDTIQSKLWDAYQGERAAADARDDGRRGQVPRLASIFTTDATLEAVAAMLETGHGLTAYRDELAGWVASFDAYRKGGDRQAWLSMWSGSPLKVDRKSQPPLYVPTPVVSVVGGVQPERLADLRGGVANDGFIDRFLLCWPAAQPIGWTDAEDDPDAVSAAEMIFTALHDRWERDPVVTRFTERAGLLMRRFVDDNAAAVGNATGLAAGWAAKGPRHLARLALVLHCLNEPDAPERPVSEATIDQAIGILEYHRMHFARCLPAMGAFGSSRPAGDAARVLRRLRHAPPGEPWIARSTLMQRTRLDAARLDAALDQLAETGVADRRTVATGTNRREDWRSLDSTREIPSADSQCSGDSTPPVESPEYSVRPEGTPVDWPRLSGVSGGIRERPPGGLWCCTGCGLPRSMAPGPCPCCKATAGVWRVPGVA